MRGATASGGGASRWAAFPVDRTPRPLVLLTPRVASSGFVTGEGKVAWGDGAITVTADVPEAVLAALPRRRPRATGPDVVLDRARRVDAPFRTDRGDVVLPAWRLDGPDLDDDGCVVLDPGVDTWWCPGDDPDLVGPTLGVPAVVEPDDVTVRFPATGGYHTEFVRAEFEEHPAYVVGRAVTREPPLPPDAVVPLILRGESVEGRLERPLGARVLVTERGSPVAVLTDR